MTRAIAFLTSLVILSAQLNAQTRIGKIDAPLQKYLEYDQFTGSVLVAEEGKTKEAVEVFKLNVAAFPKSWNVYDSLGEAYMSDGEKSLAITNYERSLELNGSNRGAVEALKKLKGVP